MERLSGGAYAAMITPFTKDDKVNEGAIEQLVEYGLAGGLAGFYLTGSTGEGLLISNENWSTWKAMMKHVGIDCGTA